MSNRQNQSDQKPEQRELFIQSPQTGIFLPANLENNSENISIDDPNPGPHVDILERNMHFENLLRSLGAVSSATGFEIASDVYSSRRAELEKRIEDVDMVAGKVQDSKTQHLIKAKNAYWNMNGTDSMVGFDSGLEHSEDPITLEGLKESYARDFDQQVISYFGDKQGRDRRDAMKKWLNYQRRVMTGQSTRRPKVELPTPPAVEHVEVPLEKKQASQGLPAQLKENKVEKKDPILAMLDGLQGHRLAGAGDRDRARIRKDINTGKSVVLQGSNGSAVLHDIPPKYEEAVATALDRGVKASDIRSILKTAENLREFKIAVKKSQKPRRRVQW